MTELTANTTYEVSLQSCNGDDSCSAWTDALEFTTEETSEPPPEPVVTAPPSPGGTPSPAPTIASPCPSTPTTATAFGPPQNLDVNPMPQRRAMLCWTPVTDATDYVVEVSEFMTTGTLAWQQLDRTDPKIGTGSDNKHLLNLDELYTSASGSKQGLADHYAYVFQVKSVEKTSSSVSESGYSDEIIIIDTPITVADGASPIDASPQTGGEAELSWTALESILVHPDYAGGTYEVRYRQSTIDPTTGIDHTTPGWGPDDFNPPRPVADDEKTTATSLTIDGLILYQVYAMQLIKRSTGPSGNVDVFAARNVYVWPSNRPADGGERVASFPLRRSLTNRTLDYRICGESFAAVDRSDAEDRRDDWVALTKDAFLRWQLTTRLITVGQIQAGCTEYRPIIDTIIEIVQDHDTAGMSEAKLRDSVENYIDGLRKSGAIQALYDKDAIRTEVLMYDDLHPAIIRLRDVSIFQEIATDIGYSKRCWYTEDNQYTANNMCTQSIRDPNGWTSDIIIRRGAFDDATGLAPDPERTDDDPLEIPPDDAKFNMCRSGSDGQGIAYSSMLHEIGHALGIRGGRGAGYTAGHALVVDSVVNYDFRVVPGQSGVAEPDCSPHPFDLMAIYALYQIG